MPDIATLLGSEAESLLGHECKTIPKDKLHLPGPYFVDQAVACTDRTPNVMRNMQQLFDHGRLSGTGYLSILPVDQGVEHSAAASFAPNPDYFDPVNIVELAREGGCNAVASTLGVLGSVARKYAHRVPFILKINHNELLTYPEKHDQILFAGVRQAFDMGAVAVGATVYFGAPESSRQIVEVSEAFQLAHELGLVTILWAYLRNPAFKPGGDPAKGMYEKSESGGEDYHLSADLTGQANHLAATVQADIVKQKQPENNGGFKVIGFGKTDPRVYSELTTDHPIDLTRWQVANCYMGRAGLINSGGGSGENDLAQAVRTAVINKRAGGMGLILGRKAFQRPMEEGIKLLHAVQDVFLSPEVTIA